MKTLTVTENIIQRLRVDITTGELLPGQKLNEIILRTKLDVSSAPLREAFRLLEKECLVSNIPRKGCYVSEISTEDCRQIYTVREMMECFAVDLIKEKKIRDLSGMEASLEKYSDLYFPEKADTYEKFEFVKKIFNFHFKLVEAAENSELNRLYYEMFPKLARYQYLYMYNYEPALVSEYGGEHKEILNHIEKGDYSPAKRLLKSHISRFARFVESRIKMKE